MVWRKMLLWRRTHRQWKRTAEEATALTRLSSERDRLAANIARQIWLASGGRHWADTRDEGATLLLEAMIVRHLTDELVRASLALNYLDLLENAAARADYEDAGSLLAEVRWVSRFLSAELGGEVVDDRDADPTLAKTASVRLEEMRSSLAAKVLDELRAGGLAA